MKARLTLMQRLTLTPDADTERRLHGAENRYGPIRLGFG